MRTPTAFALRTGTKLAKVGCDAAHWTSTLTSTAESSVVAAKRAVRKGWRAAENYVDDTAFAVKKHPLKSIGLTFGAPLG